MEKYGLWERGEYGPRAEGEGRRCVVMRGCLRNGMVKVLVMVLATCVVAGAAGAAELPFQRVAGCPYTVGGEPHVAVGDVNGDGRDDIVTGNRADNTYSILLSNEDGTFTEASNSPLDLGVVLNAVGYGGVRRIAPELVDVDRDGDVDMICDCPEGVAVFLNDGSGAFSAADGSPFSTGTPEGQSWSEPFGQAAESTAFDMNSDGHLDIVARTYQQYETILLGDGAGGFAVADGFPFNLTEELGANVGSGHGVGDFNGDGTPDFTAPFITVLGDGAGGYARGPAFAYPTSSDRPGRTDVLDWNRDGQDDFVWTTFNGTNGIEGGPKWTILTSDGAGGYSWAYGNPHRGVPHFADMNGDGFEDMVSVNNGGIFSDAYPESVRGVFVFHGDGTGTFTEAPGSPLDVWGYDVYKGESHLLAVGDVNGDGKPDIAVSHAENDSGPVGGLDKKVDIFINTTTGNFAPVIQRPLLAGGRVGQPFSYTIRATGTKPMTYGASPLPQGLSLNGNTISGTPTKALMTRVTITASNSAATDSMAFSITIIDGANRPPAITVGPTASSNPAAVGHAVSLSVAATDADGDGLSYSWTFADGSTSLPQAGPSVSHTYQSPGEYQVFVTVTDGKGGAAFGAVTMDIRELADPGDLNGDGAVNVDDVSLVTRHFTQTPESPGWDGRADANWDGVVDQADLVMVRENFGRKYE